jgi:lipoprotein-anchoring transpeptidase ErfK/SrfK
MNTSSLNQRTVRPGSLSGYSGYAKRQTIPRSTYSLPKPSTSRGFKAFTSKVLVTLLVLGAIIVLPLLRNDPATNKQADSSTQLNTAAKQSSASSGATKQSPAAAAPIGTETDKTNHCAGNIEDKLVKISVGQRKLWACEHEKTVHTSPVITGLETAASNLTPRGTYKVYAKAANTTLKGQDERGVWNRPVYYWMPFLDNDYGTYGFHDATWRPDSDFGNIDPNTSQDASRGCVELPLASQKWLYEWGPVGLTVVIEN